MPEFPSEAIIILFFLLISFLSWITEKVKSYRAEKPPSPPQAERHAPPPRADRQTPSRAPERSQREAPKKEGSDTMREILQSLGIPVEPEEEEKEPPPLPPSEPAVAAVEAVPISAKARRIAKTAAKAKAATDKVQDALSKQELEALKHVKSQGEKVQRRETRYHSSPVQSLLKRENLQSAVIVKEILDKPKCLRPDE